MKRLRPLLLYAFAHVAWSPDGERLAFTSRRAGRKDEAPCTGAPQSYGEIFVMGYDGSQLEPTAASIHPMKIARSTP